MLTSLRWLVRVVAISAALGATPALAQTVVIKAAQPGAPIEVIVNTGTPQTATADAQGIARLSVVVPPGVDTSAVRLVVEACALRVRVTILTAGTVAPSSGCVPTEIPWVFVMRPRTSFLVDFEGSSPTVLVRQGSVPNEWMKRFVAGEPVEVGLRPSTGLMLAGQFGLSGFRRALNIACGTSPCSGDDVGNSYGVGGTYWFSDRLGVDVAYTKPSAVSVTGTGTDFSFKSTLDTSILTMAATIGGPIGRVRMYGIGGFNYHEALFTQNTTIGGVTQTSQVKTTGWGWVFGPGLELWFTPSIAFFSEGQYLWVQGSDFAGGEGKTSDFLTVVKVGGRIRLWK